MPKSSEVPPEEYMLEENEERSMIEPKSYDNPKLKDLIKLVQVENFSIFAGCLHDFLVTSGRGLLMKDVWLIFDICLDLFLTVVWIDF
jgi:hypothetical protein